jgi:hypothetical protein
MVTIEHVKIYVSNNQSINHFLPSDLKLYNLIMEHNSTCLIFAYFVAIKCLTKYKGRHRLLQLKDRVAMSEKSI